MAKQPSVTAFKVISVGAGAAEPQWTTSRTTRHLFVWRGVWVICFLTYFYFYFSSSIGLFSTRYSCFRGVKLPLIRFVFLELRSPYLFPLNKVTASNSLSIVPGIPRYLTITRYSPLRPRYPTLYLQGNGDGRTPPFLSGRSQDQEPLELLQPTSYSLVAAKPRTRLLQLPCCLSCLFTLEGVNYFHAPRCKLVLALATVSHEPDCAPPPHTHLSSRDLRSFFLLPTSGAVNLSAQANMSC